MQNNKDKIESTARHSEGRLIAADFFTYTLKAFVIGVATSAVLGGAVVLLAQSSAQDDATTTSERQEIRQAP
jgi:thiol:disulfide interchange protein